MHFHQMEALSSEKILVWMDNKDNLVNGWESSLTLKKDENLILIDTNQTLVWESKTDKSDNVVNKRHAILS